MAITPLWKAGMEFGNLKEFSNYTDVELTTTYAKTGTYAVRLKKLVTSGPRLDQNVVSSQMRIGFHIRPATLDSSSDQSEIFYIYGTSGILAEIEINTATHTLDLYILGSKVDTCPLPNFLIWQHWGVDWKADAAAGWFNFYIDGAEALSFSGNTGTNASSMLRWGWVGTNDWYSAEVYLDDLYIDDTTGEPAPAPPPDKRFALARPTSDVAKNWTPSTGTDHFALVDESPVSETDYLSATASGTVDTFGIAAPTYPTGYSVAAVWPTAQAWKANAAADSSLTLRATDGVNTDDGAALNLPSTTGIVTERFPLQPDGSAWDNTDFATTNFGIVSSGSFA